MVQSLWLHGHGQYEVYAELKTIDLCFLPAIKLTRLLRNKEISAREVVSAHLQQIERVNTKVNAIVTLVPEQALAEADRPGFRKNARGCPRSVARAARGT